MCWTKKCHRHKHGTVIWAAQLGHAVQEDSGHLLILVLDEAEHLKGETTHLTLSIFKHCRLWVFVTPSTEDKKQDTRCSASAYIDYHIQKTTSTNANKHTIVHEMTQDT